MVAAIGLTLVAGAALARRCHSTACRAGREPQNWLTQPERSGSGTALTQITPENVKRLGPSGGQARSLGN